MSRLSTELSQYLFQTCEGDRVTLTNLLQVVDKRVFGVLFVLLALPSALPVPAPGYSIPFGILLFILAVQLMAGARNPWMPKRLAQHPFQLDKAQGILNAGLPWLKLIEAITHPRMSFICRGVLGKLLIGGAIAIMSISMMIPIPGTNTIPAIGIFVLGFGLFEEDGLISLLGLMICAAGLAVTTGIIVGIYFGGSSLAQLIQDWLVNIGILDVNESAP